MAIDRAEFKFNWDAGTRLLSMPLQILSGGDRITLIARIEAPQQPSGVWSFSVGGGAIVLAGSGAASEPLVLNRIAVSGRYDAAKERLVVEEGDMGNTNVGVAWSGMLDWSAGAPRLAAGFAGTRMPVDVTQTHLAGLPRPKSA